MIFASDEVEFSTHGGDKKGWPIYMTIGNLPSDVRSSPVSNAWLLLAVLPNPPKQSESSGKHADLWTRYKNDVLHQVLQHIFSRYNDLYTGGVEIPCSDGRMRICHPIIGGWIADLKEYSNLLHVQNNACMVCDTPVKHMGDGSIGEPRKSDIIQAKVHQYIEVDEILARHHSGEAPLPKIDVSTYTKQRKSLANWFKQFGLRIYDNTFWQLERCSHGSLWRPDILHTIYEGMVKKLFDWLEMFLREIDRFRLFNLVWISIPAYNGTTAPSKSFYDISQLNGKELRQALRHLLPVIVIVLRKRSTKETEKFDKVISCVRYLVDFCLMTHYKSHTKETIDLMNHYLAKFHETKEVFLKYRASAKARRKAREGAKSIREKGEEERQSDLTQHGFVTQANKPSEVSVKARELQDSIEKEESHFNFQKIHHLAHFGMMILLVGFLQQWSTETGETLHRDLKDGYRSSNHVNATPQVIRFTTRRYNIRMRELNLHQIACDGYYQSDIQDVLGIYANASDKNKMAKLARQGYSFKDRTRIFRGSTGIHGGKGTTNNGLPEEDEDGGEIPEPRCASDAAAVIGLPEVLEELVPDDDDMEAEGTEGVEGAKQKPILPLWRAPQPLKRRWVKGSVPKLRNYKRLSVIEEHYHLPNISKHISTYIRNSLQLGSLSEGCIKNLEASVKTSVHIVVDNFNAEGYTTMKAVCTPPNKTGKCRQDNVFYTSYKTNGHFANQNVGRLLCILKLRLPTTELWDSLEYLPKVPENQCTEHLLALIQPYTIDNDGIIHNVYSLARCQLSTSQPLVMSIDSITRLAMLVPEPLVAPQADVPKAWWINNRIDDGTWNLFYRM